MRNALAEAPHLDGRVEEHGRLTHAALVVEEGDRLHG
jgi:hypothetical protein